MKNCLTTTWNVYIYIFGPEKVYSLYIYLVLVLSFHSLYNFYRFYLWTILLPNRLGIYQTISNFDCRRRQTLYTDSIVWVTLCIYEFIIADDDPESRSPNPHSIAIRDSCDCALWSSVDCVFHRKWIDRLRRRHQGRSQGAEIRMGLYVALIVVFARLR